MGARRDAGALVSGSGGGSTNVLPRFVGKMALVLMLVWASDAVQLRDQTQIDYCHSETFNAECEAEDEVLVVRSASYGRMRGSSRCLQSDRTSYVGCKANVLRQADRMCSGRRACRIAVPNPSFEVVQPCPKASRSYLEIVVECQRVMSVPQSVQCGPDWPVAVRGSPTETGFLSSFVAVQRGFGSPSCPWRVETEPGRRINITLIDFATPTASDPLLPGQSPLAAPDYQGLLPSMPTPGGASVSRICYQYATISERPGLVGTTMMARSFQVCGGDRRERHVTLSTSNVVDVQFSRRNAETDREFYFLLQYRAVGCAEPQAPRHGWLIRERGGMAVTVGCNSTGLSWRLTCSESRWSWSGDFDIITDRCPKSYVRSDRVSMTWNTLNIPFKVTLTILVGLAVTAIIVLLLFVLICAECVRNGETHHNHHNSQQQQQQHQHHHHQQHQHQQQRYFEMVPNGCSNDDDDYDYEDDDEIGGRYDSIAAITARSRSKSLPRNVAAARSATTNAQSAAITSVNRAYR